MSRIHARGLPDFDRRATVFCSIGALPEVIEHRKTGWLYPSGGHEPSDRGLVTLLCSPELYSQRFMISTRMARCWSETEFIS